MLDGLIHKDDMKDVLKRAQEREVEKKVADKLKAMSKSAKPRLLRITPCADFSESAARMYLPNEQGCKLRKDVRMHQCWQVFYPTRVSPFSCTRVWNHTRSSTRALYEVLEWCWNEHHSACPWDLTSMLLDKDKD